MALHTVQQAYWKAYLKHWTQPELQEVLFQVQSAYRRVATRHPRTDFDTSEMEVLTDLEELISALLLPALLNH